ncbi:hypothetical protein BJY16_004657 [Actinoplanes octamycinicus]|uniref:Uncharacterized protein n=1 Tax=Actinoplanes octamycinicus TaxID=135948 RepID=A0A7W7M8Q5_9ACTN|nr:Eco29kI family restriction endonuclease [Actinoplanes octamycinicus]MBB4741198.1 hypothetical protein [Actinoplanes octamycinicus]GIE56104.1 hypothetical protein Aoc01nite_15060 [Actinoplanes octamycinicus]
MAEEDDLTVLAMELNRLMAAKNWQIATLVRESARGRTAVSQALNARRGRPVPSVGTVVAICRALGVDDQPLVDLLRRARMTPSTTTPVPTVGDRPGAAGVATASSGTVFNPLDLRNLVRSVERELESVPPVPLDAEVFSDDDGLFALYYTGKHPLYRPISSPQCVTPIYLGSVRVARSPSVVSRSGLRVRAAAHRRSIEQCSDLKTADFRVRALPTVAMFIPEAEGLMRSRHRPVWNAVVTGFGNHPGGTGRLGAPRSDWDELHPGRQWAAPMASSRRTAGELREAVERHFSEHPPA